MNTPSSTPERGFYWHYKHNPQGAINDYAYEVLGVGFHTEDDCRPEDVHLVVYRPLYESSIYKAGRFFDIRPLSMFMEYVTIEGRTIPRFKKIEDPAIIARLGAIRDTMYNIPAR